MGPHAAFQLAGPNDRTLPRTDPTTSAISVMGPFPARDPTAEVAVEALRRAGLFHCRFGIPAVLSRRRRFALAADIPALIRIRLPALVLLRPDRFERGDALASNGFEGLAERVPVVGDELGAVARAGYLDVEGFLRGQLRVIGLHRRGDAVDGAALDRLVHHATILEMNVESYRRRAALDRRKKGPRRPAKIATGKNTAKD